MYSLPFYGYCVCELLSHVQLFATPWGVARQSLVYGILQARILGSVAISFSRGSSWPRDRTWVLCIAGGLFTIWATRETQKNWSNPHSQQESKMQYLSAVSKTTEWSPFIVLQALCLSDLIPWIYLSLSLYNHKGFDLGHTWMI